MKNKKNIYFILVALLLAFATYQAADLSLKQWNNPGACPSIGPVPACYVVLVGFLTGLIGHLAGIRMVFFVGLGVPTALAAFASVGELFGFIVCPRTDGGIPMCYLSLSLCIVTWILWSRIKAVPSDQS